MVPNRGPALRLTQPRPLKRDVLEDFSAKLSATQVIRTGRGPEHITRTRIGTSPVGRAGRCFRVRCGWNWREETNTWDKKLCRRGCVVSRELETAQRTPPILGLPVVWHTFWDVFFFTVCGIHEISFPILSLSTHLPFVPFQGVDRKLRKPKANRAVIEVLGSGNYGCYCVFVGFG